MPDRNPSCRRYAGTFPAQAVVMRQVRDEVASVARECGVPEDGIGDIRLAVTEVATNAILHAYGHDQTPGDAGEIRVEIFLEADEFLVVVADDGVGLAPRVDSPGLGLGLPVVASLVKRFDVRSTEGDGTEVHLVFPCPGRDPRRG